MKHTARYTSCITRIKEGPSMTQSAGALPSHTIALIVAGCAAPTAALNIWPRIEQILEQGLNGNQVGIVILVTMSALGMTAIPFAMKKADNWGFWLTCLFFGLFLCLLNYAMAVGAIGKVRDHDAKKIEDLQARAASVESRIKALQDDIAALPSFKWTTDEMVDTADTAVALAIQARDQECGKVGDFCRARVQQLAARQADLAEARAARALTKRKEALSSQLLETQNTKASLGSIPEYVDPQAARIASVLRVIGFHLGSSPIETTANALIQFLAIAAEAFGLLMPRILVTALAPAAAGPPAEAPHKALPPPPVKTINLKAIDVTPKPAPLTRAKRLQIETLFEWQKHYLAKSPGKSLPARQAYEAYAKLRKDPLSFEEFDKQIIATRGPKGDYMNLKLV